MSKRQINQIKNIANKLNKIAFHHGTNPPKQKGPRTPGRKKVSHEQLQRLTDIVKEQNEKNTETFFEQFANFICKNNPNTLNCKNEVKKDLKKRIKFFDTDTDTKQNELVLVDRKTNIENIEKYACLTFFQYLDILHDAKHKKGPLSTYITFLNTTKNVLASIQTIENVRTYALDIYHDNKKVPITIYGTIFRQMLLETTNMIDVKKNSVKKQKTDQTETIIVRRMNERAIFLSVLKVVLGFYTKFKVMKKDSNIIPKGRINATPNTKDGIVSLDMTNKCLIQQFTANYSKYIHLSNLGDFGIRFLPDIDIQYILKKVLRTYGDYSNTKFLNAHTANGTNNKSVTPNNVYFDTQPFRLVMGEYLTVEVVNNLVDTKPIVKNQMKQFGEFFRSKINPQLDLLIKNKPRKSLKFQTAQETKECDTYECYLQKHLGDFMQAANAISKGVVFASGDSLACLGYLIAYTFKVGNDRNTNFNKPEMKFMWEDVTNQQIVYGTSSDIETNRKRHFNKLTVTNFQPIPNPLTKEQFDKGTNTNNNNNKINIKKYNPYNLNLNRIILRGNIPDTRTMLEEFNSMLKE